MDYDVYQRLIAKAEEFRQRLGDRLREQGKLELDADDADVRAFLDECAAAGVDPVELTAGLAVGETLHDKFETPPQG